MSCIKHALPPSSPSAGVAIYLFLQRLLESWLSMLPWLVGCPQALLIVPMSLRVTVKPIPSVHSTRGGAEGYVNGTPYQGYSFISSTSGVGVAARMSHPTSQMDQVWDTFPSSIFSLLLLYPQLSFSPFSPPHPLSPQLLPAHQHTRYRAAMCCSPQPAKDQPWWWKRLTKNPTKLLGWRRRRRGTPSSVDTTIMRRVRLWIGVILI